MTLRKVFAVAVLGAISALPLVARADEALAKKYNCTSCHQAEKKGVGPAYKDVAKKYKGQANAATALADKVKKGGSGAWGPVPMPPNAAVPDADVKKLVEWVLAM